MNTKKVSVVVPTYNAEKFVAETIRSLLAQTYQNFEIIVVDDGSPDRSVDVCRRFSDPRLKIIRQSNRGLPGARNTGIRNAQGDFIAFLDADDLWLPDKLEKHVRHFEKLPEVGISFSYSAFINERSEYTGLYQVPRRIRKITPAYVLCRNPVGNGSAAVIRRETFEAIKFQDEVAGSMQDCYFDEQLRFEKADATDLECWTRIAATTPWKLEGIPEPLTLYRINSGGLSANAMTQYRAIEKVIEKACTIAPHSLGAYENLAKAYYMRYVARRAVTLRDGDLAVDMIHQALNCDRGILREEPGRTLLTLAAAYSLRFTPRSLYTWMENTALKVTGASQKQRISSETTQLTNEVGVAIPIDG